MGKNTRIAQEQLVTGASPTENLEGFPLKQTLEEQT